MPALYDRKGVRTEHKNFSAVLRNSEKVTRIELKRYANKSGHMAVFFKDGGRFVCDARRYKDLSRFVFSRHRYWNKHGSARITEEFASV